MMDIELDERGRQVITPEYGGKWIAWNKDNTRIIASGDDMLAVKHKADALGETDPILEAVPSLDSYYVGGP